MGKFYPHLFLLATQFVSVGEGFFELTRHPSMALKNVESKLPLALLLEIQSNKYTVSRDTLRGDDSGLFQEQLTQTLIIVCLSKRHLS